MPPMLMLPTRPVDDEFAATLKPTDPLPVPVAAVVTVIHGARLLTVHGQPALAVIATVPVAPAAGTDVEVG